MSAKGSKGGLPPRKEEPEIGSLGRLREGLPEIGHDSFKDWEPILYKLWEKLREHTQDLQSIIQDQLKLTLVPSYKVYIFPEVTNEMMDQLAPEKDPMGIKRMLFQGRWNSQNQAYLKKIDRQEQDKTMVYTLIRSMCSPQLNALLVVDAGFIACSEDDPLALLGVIKRLITARPDGNEELDRQKALGEWLTLRMDRGEKIIDYGRRAVKVFDRLSITGIKVADQPLPAQQAMRFIDGLDSSIPAFHGYKLYLINSKQQTDRDIYPPTLVDAIKKATLFESSWTANSESTLLTTAPLSAFGAQGPPPGDKRQKNGKSTKGKGDKGKVPYAKDKKDGTDKIISKARFDGECHHCGKYGHRMADCRSRAKEESSLPQHTKYVKPVKSDKPVEKQVSFYSTFGTMPDEGDDHSDIHHRKCNITFQNTGEHHISLPVTTTSIQPTSTEAIFDTGATGSIITWAPALNDIETCTPTIYKGLHGSLTVTKAGRLGDIGIVHFDNRAAMSIISASDTLRQGHTWEFQRGSSTNTDAFLVHTPKFTYRFQHRDGLYFCDLAKKPEPRHMNAILQSFQYPRPTIVVTPKVTMLYTTKLPTTEANEAEYSKREVARSVYARRLQAILGFPPDIKFITALKAGTFLNCDVLPEDVTRASAIWGPSIPALKGRTVRARPSPPPQLSPSLRSLSVQHMHCDIMFVNKQPFLVSITHPIGMVLVEHIANLTAIAIRPALRKMFGAFGSRRIKITMFTSDNERGIAALAGDMSGMGVEVISVGPGQHDHTIERMIRHLKEVIRATKHSLPFLVPDFMMTIMVVLCGNKLNLFPSSSTRTDNVTPLEAFTNRKMDLKLDTGEPTFSYCHVHDRTMSNGMAPRTIGCLYAGPRINGTGTHMFVNLATKAVLFANHYVVLPIPPIVISTINGWASTNKIHTVVDPIFTYRDRDITHDAPDDLPSIPTPSPTSNENATHVEVPPPDSHVPDPSLPANESESPILLPPMEIRGDTDNPVDLEDSEHPTDHIGKIVAPMDPFSDTPTETPAVQQEHVRTHPLPAPVILREKSTRVRRPVDRLNLGAQEVHEEALEKNAPHAWALMSVPRALKLFPGPTSMAIKSEVTSLLAKDTFSAVDRSSLMPGQQKRVLRSIMNITEKFLPTVDSNGNRELDKIKARFCVDGRDQVRADYTSDEIESPTASMAAIFAVAQLAAAEGRFVMVGDVGSAYLNAHMPTDNPDKILHMIIESDVADEIIRQDKSFGKYRMRNGNILVRLNKALYGTIQSAKLWYDEIAGTLKNNGFTANPRDLCIFNKGVGDKQFTIVVYVDDLKMTCVDKSAVLEMEQILLKIYGQFRTTQGPIVSYLGLTWDYSEIGYVKVSQSGMIQDIVARREKFHADRGTKLTGIPKSPAPPYLFDRTPDGTRLTPKEGEQFWTDTASLAWASTRAHPALVTAIGELSRHVTDPTTEDSGKLDRAISFAKSVRDVPLRLKTTLPPRVTVSIDAAFANRNDMRSTSGTCVTLGVGYFIASSKIQKLNSKSSTEAEIIAVSDGMNIPLWLADFLRLQGYPSQPVRLEQDNQSCITLLTKGRSTAETTRFIEIRKFWISAYIKNGAVDIVYVPTEDMTSDYFTKPLQGALFAKMFAKIMGQE